MKRLLVTTPEAKIQAKVVRQFVPDRLTGWRIKAVPARSLGATATVPDMTWVQLSDQTRWADLKAMIPRLAHLQGKARRRSYVVFSFRAESKRGVPASGAQRSHFNSVAEQINDELGTFPNPDRVNVIFSQGSFELRTVVKHIGAKLDLDITVPMHNRVASSQKPRSSPLDRIKGVIESTEDLRLANGNLSAQAVAAAFGISLSQLAGWLGRTRQALNKTPDADAIQDQLAFFERVARLRAVVPGNRFQKWLRMKNRELDDQTPLNLLAGAERQVVADLVDDMLTGAPA